jgi:hypothetical protein
MAKKVVFQTWEGVKAGISPLLFNLVGDIVTKMLQKGAENGTIKGIA